MAGLDPKKRSSEEQIIGFLKEADPGVPVKELCRKRDFSKAGHFRGPSGVIDG